MDEIRTRAGVRRRKRDATIEGDDGRQLRGRVHSLAEPRTTFERVQAGVQALGARAKALEADTLRLHRERATVRRRTDSTAQQRDRAAAGTDRAASTLRAQLEAAAKALADATASAARIRAELTATARAAGAVLDSLALERLAAAAERHAWLEERVRSQRAYDTLAALAAVRTRQVDAQAALIAELKRGRRRGIARRLEDAFLTVGAGGACGGVGLALGGPMTGLGAAAACVGAVTAVRP